MLGFPLPLSTAPECLFCLLSLEYRKLKFVHIMLFALELWTRPPLTAFDVGPIVNGILIIIWSQLLCSTRGLQCTVFCLFARDRNRAFCHSACLPVDNDAARGSQVTMICGPPPWATVALCKSGSFIAQQITKLCCPRQEWNFDHATDHNTLADGFRGEQSTSLDWSIKFRFLVH